MKISYNWLKEYVDIKLSPEELGRLFTMSGLSVESIEAVAEDHIFEIEVTSNRPDWLSVIGVAREVAALTGKKIKIPSVLCYNAAKPRKKSKKKVCPVPPDARGESLRFSVKIEDKKLCPKYTARVITDVAVGESPDWLKRRLEAMGLRSINNVVDITNFCLFETGEPMHAFDLDKISGRVITVRKAKKGERLKTIDGVERLLDESMIVIADSKGPIALAGIMGGLDTEVTASTKNILLEAASFDPIAIRRASRRFALSTESSYRFERKVAIANIEYASLRATALIKEIAGGVPGEFTESVGKVKDIRSVTLRLSRLNKLLGIYIPTSKVKGILTALGLKIGKSSKDSITLHVPDFRNDISSEVDCIEEVARAYGYGKVAGTIPGIVDQSERLERKRVIAKNIRATLAANGAFEIITYSLISRKAIESSRCALEHIAEVRNPLSGEQEVMRSTLLPGMLNAILWNINRKNKNLKLFELGNVYKKTGEDKFEEVESLSIAVTGEMVSGWQVPARPADFYDLKGIVEKVVEELGVAGITFKASDRPGLAKGVCADIFLSGGTIGFIGEVDHKVTHDFDVKDKIYFAQLTTGPLCEKSVLKKTFQAIPRYPSVSRDISVIVSKDIINLDLIGCINGAAGPLLKSVELVDRYKGKQISGDNISMTYRLEYQDPSRTLEEKDIQDVHARVLNALAARFGAKQR